MVETNNIVKQIYCSENLKDQQNQTKEKLLQISTRILGADLKCKANVQKK